jgi:hypothetical protein
MNFIEKLANYNLGNYSWKDLPGIALTALEENIESDSMTILAGMSDKDNSFELEQYFVTALKEVDISVPSKLISAKILIRYHLRKMVRHQEGPFELMRVIDNKIYRRVDWELELKGVSKNFLGEELGLEKMYTWYRELQDFGDGSLLLYYTELPKAEQKAKFEEHLIKEAERILRHIDNEITTHNTGI